MTAMTRDEMLAELRELPDDEARRMLVAMAETGMIEGDSCPEHGSGFRPTQFGLAVAMAILKMGGSAHGLSTDVTVIRLGKQ